MVTFSPRPCTAEGLRKQQDDCDLWFTVRSLKIPKQPYTSTVPVRDRINFPNLITIKSSLYFTVVCHSVATPRIRNGSQLPKPEIRHKPSREGSASCKTFNERDLRHVPYKEKLRQLNFFALEHIRL